MVQILWRHKNSVYNRKKTEWKLISEVKYREHDHNIDDGTERDGIVKYDFRLLAYMIGWT